MTEYKAEFAQFAPEKGPQDIDQLRMINQHMKLSLDGDAAQDNTARASWAAVGLIAFCDRVRDGDEDLEIVFSDFLADLRHLADATGVDWETADMRGEDNYQAEIAGRF